MATMLSQFEFVSPPATIEASVSALSLERNRGPLVASAVARRETHDRRRRELGRCQPGSQPFGAAHLVEHGTAGADGAIGFERVPACSPDVLVHCSQRV